MLCDSYVKVFAAAITANVTGTVNGANTALQLDGGEAETYAFGKIRTAGGGSDSTTKCYLETSATGSTDDWIVAASYNASGAAGTQDVAGAVNLLNYVRLRVEIGGTAYSSCYAQAWVGSSRYVGVVS